MNVFLKLSQFYMPGFIQKKKLNQLFALTARAFGCAPPLTKNLSYEQALHKYALFTQQHTEIYLKESIPLDHLKEKLYREAYQLGQDLRKKFGIAASDEVIFMMRIMYKMLGIDLRCSSENNDENVIHKCFFSRYYSPEVCKIIASLDEGIAAGLSNGGNLRFYQRITEGNSCCRAAFALKEGQS